LIDDCKKDIIPYEELWALVRDHNAKKTFWEQEPLFK